MITLLEIAEITNQVHEWMAKHFLSFQMHMQGQIDAGTAGGLTMESCVSSYMTDWGFIWDKEGELKQIASEMEVEYLKLLEWMAHPSIKPPAIRNWQQNIEPILRQGEQQ